MITKAIRIFLLAVLIGISLLGAGCSGESHGNNGQQNSMRVLVPVYFDPSSHPAEWNRLYAQSAKMPGKLWIIASPDSGPGDRIDSLFVNAIDSMHQNSGHVVGYINTDYGDISFDTVKAKIDSWYRFYPSLDGIFFDCQDARVEHIGYYKNLFNYVKNKNTSALVIGNPGSETIENYLIDHEQRVSDVICIFESGTDFGSWCQSDEWYVNYSRDNFYALPYNTSSNQWRLYTDHAADINCGWIYCTNGTGSARWNSLPSYFEDFCDYVATK